MVCSASVSLTRLLLDDPYLHLRGHLGVQPDRDGVDTQTLDRLAELDAPFVDDDPLFRERLGNVARGDRTVQHGALAPPAHEAPPQRLDPAGPRLALLLLLGQAH